MINSSFTLAQKIGHLLIVGFQGISIQDPWVQKIIEDIKLSRIGGVISYGYNIVDPTQITELNYIYSSTARKAGLPPPFITADQEGVKVQRLSREKGFIGFPSPQEMTHKDLSHIKSLYGAMACELTECGFNWDFAPSVDMDPKGYKCPILGALG